MFRNNDVSDGGLPVLVEPPTEPAISRADCKKALGIAASDISQDGAIAAALAAVAATLDPAFAGWLGRALREQTWELRLRDFNDRRPALRGNTDAIELPYPPLLSMVSVKYYDVNGVDTTLALNTDFRILGQGDPYGRQAIAPLYSKSWPTARSDDGSVRIRYTCGYDDDVNVMPPNLVQAVCLGARALLTAGTRDLLVFEDRVEGVGSLRYQNNPQILDVVTMAIGGLLGNLKV